jgi:riboflavin synthase
MLYPMFTGIVERSVRVASVSDGTGFRRLNLAVDWADARTGESVAVNGACLTIAELSRGLLAFDVVPETLAKTNLGALRAGDMVHVERALRVGDRIDGHFVQGHVDGLALLLEQAAGAGEDEVRLRCELPPELAKYVVPKGSVCLDGVSLTVAAASGQQFEVALIPTTVQLTRLASREKGWRFNFEADVLSKTIISFLERRGV